MTKVILTSTKYGQPALKINGRLTLVKRITEISCTDVSWEWTGYAGGYKFRIFGGKASGGAANEWFVQWDALGEFTMNATSFTDAVNIIEKS